MGRASRWRTGVLVALVTLVVIALAAELGLRLAGARAKLLESNVSLNNRRWVALTRGGLLEEVPDTTRRYALRPGAEVEIDGWRFRVSSAGTRGPDVPTVKGAGERRILCLGDSFAFGLWCDESETVAARLAEHATERERERGTGIVWRPLDLAVPGYHLGQELRAFETDGLALEPDLVVLYYNTNDIEKDGYFFDASLGVLRRDYMPLPVALKSTLWHWSHLYGWLSSRQARAIEAGPTPYLNPGVPWAHVRADNQEYARAALARIVELCRERSLPLFVIDQPLMTYMGSARSNDWPVLPLDAWFRGVCGELGVPALHLLGWLRGYSDGVDRFAEGAPPDFLTDLYIADERLQAAVTAARANARAAGEDFDALPLDRQVAFFSGVAVDVPKDPDFHLTGAGYAHIARLAYARLQAEGMLP